MRRTLGKGGTAEGRRGTAGRGGKTNEGLVGGWVDIARLGVVGCRFIRIPFEGRIWRDASPQGLPYLDGEDNRPTGVHRDSQRALWGALELEIAAAVDVVAFWNYVQVVMRLGSRHVGAARALWVTPKGCERRVRVGEQPWIGGEDGGR